MIINFVLSRIAIEKLEEQQGNIEAKNSIKFTEVHVEKTPDGLDDQSIIRFKFTYNIQYKPKIGTTQLEGFVHFLTTANEGKKIAEEWKKEKKIDQKVSTHLINYVFSKCGVKALSLSQELNLPPHIPLPRIAVKKKQEETEQPKAS